QGDPRVGDDLVPIGRPALVAVPFGGGTNRLLVPPGDRNQPRPQRRGASHVGDLAERVRVGLAHEGVPEHPDADLRDVADRGFAPVSRQRTHDRAIAASKASAEGAKSLRRTNASASCAPYSRSIPESSHSIDSGP